MLAPGRQVTELNTFRHNTWIVKGQSLPEPDGKKILRLGKHRYFG